MDNVLTEHAGEYGLHLNDAALVHEISACAVACVIISRNRPEALARTIGAVNRQTRGNRIIVVDCSTDATVADGVARRGVEVIRSAVNLGGAGGFALGLLSALAAGVTWIWLMDDDGRPLETTTLQTLLGEAERIGLDAVAPLVMDEADHDSFAFPYRLGGRARFLRADLPKGAFIPGMAHLFNGLLIRADVLFRVGLPDLRMFIRGDEVDFMLRMRRAGLRFGTTANAAFTHPSANRELFPLFGGVLHVAYPDCGWKRRCQFRNRAYTQLRHPRVLHLLVDPLRYGYFFLITRRLDFSGMAEWLACSWQGWRGRLHAEGPGQEAAP